MANFPTVMVAVRDTFAYVAVIVAVTGFADADV
jgi:hypothetical protein